MKLGYIAFYVFMLIQSFGLLAQTGELDRFDCNYSKEINVPFNYSGSGTLSNQPNLNQLVFYSYRDQFTYWYQINVEKESKLHITIATLNDSDTYAVYFYKYNGDNFCKKVYDRLITPIYNSVYIGLNSDAKIISKDIKAYKGDIIYVSVLALSKKFCGHVLNLNYETKDTLVVNARHFPCERDLTSISVNSIPVNSKASNINPIETNTLPINDSTTRLKNTNCCGTISKDTIANNKKQNKEPKNTIKKDSVLIPNTAKKEETLSTNATTITQQNTVLNSRPILKTNVSINVYGISKGKELKIPLTKLFVNDVDARNYLAFDKLNDTIWQGEIETKKRYTIKAQAFGYKDLEITYDSITNREVTLFLEPLKVGDNFVMKSIYFHPNTFALKRESSEELNRLLQYLTKNPEVTIEIQGHTNGDNKIIPNKGYEGMGEEWNFKGSSKNLSLKRAEAIKKFLVTNGVSKTRLKPLGIGGDKPVIKDPETIHEAQRNIRVEVVILSN